MSALDFNKPVILIGLVFLSLGIGAATAAVTVSTLQDSPNDLAAAEGTLNDSTNLSVQAVDVAYTGLTADSLTVNVSNDDATSGSGAHDYDMHIEVYDDAQTFTYTDSKAGNTFAETTSFNETTFSGVNADVREWDAIDVNVEETS